MSPTSNRVAPEPQPKPGPLPLSRYHFDREENRVVLPQMTSYATLDPGDDEASNLLGFERSVFEDAVAHVASRDLGVMQMIRVAGRLCAWHVSASPTISLRRAEPRGRDWTSAQGIRTERLAMLLELDEAGVPGLISFGIGGRDGDWVTAWLRNLPEPRALSRAVDRGRHGWPIGGHDDREPGWVEGLRIPPGEIPAPAGGGLF